MAHPRITPQQEAAILALRKQGKTYRQIRELTRHGIHTIGRVVHGRPPKKRQPRKQECAECGTTTGPFYKRLCVEHAARAALRAVGRII